MTFLKILQGVSIIKEFPDLLIRLFIVNIYVGDIGQNVEFPGSDHRCEKSRRPVLVDYNLGRSYIVLLIYVHRDSPSSCRNYNVALPCKITDNSMVHYVDWYRRRHNTPESALCLNLLTEYPAFFQGKAVSLLPCVYFADPLLGVCEGRIVPVDHNLCYNADNIPGNPVTVENIPEHPFYHITDPSL